MRIGRYQRVAVFLRSFAIQGAWNYRTLIGNGFGFALLPVLRKLYHRDPERLQDSIERHTQLFNSHPYLAPMALGAVATLEAQGEDPRVVERFKAAVRGSLGTLGDRLVWAGWRPVCLLFALALLLVGAPWWVGVVAFLVIYNIGHIRLRLWAYRLGLEEGRFVGERLRRSPVLRLQTGAAVVGAFLAGLLVPLVIAGRFLPSMPEAGSTERVAWAIIAAFGAIFGIRMGIRARYLVVLLLVLFMCFGIMLRNQQ